MRPIVRPYYKGKAWVHLIDPTQTTVVRDWETGTSIVTPMIAWSGWARVQPIRNTVSTWRATNPTTTRVIQFWVEDPETLRQDYRPGLRFAVDPAVEINDPGLYEYLYVVLGGLNSTQAWQRTIDTQADLENRPDYDMADWPKPEAFGMETPFGEGDFG